MLGFVTVTRASDGTRVHLNLAHTASLRAPTEAELREQRDQGATSSTARCIIAASDPRVGEAFVREAPQALLGAMARARAAVFDAEVTGDPQVLAGLRLISDFLGTDDAIRPPGEEDAEAFDAAREWLRGFAREAE